MLKIEDIKSEFVSYNEMLNEIGEKKFKEKYSSLLEEAETFLKSMGYADRVNINKMMLIYSVMGYFSDVQRIKSWRIAKVSSRVVIVHVNIRLNSRNIDILCN